jgi:hypothetical protein
LRKYPNKKTHLLFLFLLNPDLKNKDAAKITGLDVKSVKTYKWDFKKGEML